MSFFSTVQQGHLLVASVMHGSGCLCHGCPVMTHDTWSHLQPAFHNGAKVGMMLLHMPVMKESHRAACRLQGFNGCCAAIPVTSSTAQNLC